MLSEDQDNAFPILAILWHVVVSCCVIRCIVAPPSSLLHNIHPQAGGKCGETDNKEFFSCSRQDISPDPAPLFLFKNKLNK